MKKTQRLLAALMLTTLVAFATGCSKLEDWLENGNDSVPVDVVNINPDYVPIDWENTTLTTSDDSTGSYQISFNDTTPEIVVGSILAIDRDTSVRYVLVTAVTLNGNVASISSVPAQLTDIFYDSDFTLSTASSSKSSSGAYIRPAVAYMIEDDGSYRQIALGGGNKADTRLTGNLWHYDIDHDGEELCSGNNWSVTMEKMNLHLSLDLEMRMNFSGRTIREVAEAYEHYRSRALRVEAALVGTFNTEQKVRCDIEGNCSYSPDYDLWKHNLLKPISVKFVVGGVPVVVTLRSDLFRQVELSASGEIEAYTGFSNAAEGRLGFEWSQAGGIGKVESFSNNFQYTPPTVEGKGQIQAKAWVFPRISLALYDVVGPSFDFKPYLSTTVTGGFREQLLGQSNDYCAWNLDCNAGVDACCGLSLRFFGYEVENYSTPDWNMVDKSLYHSPQKVEHQTGRPGVGEAATVKFKVYDRNNLTGQNVPTPLPQIVKFEADGDLSSEYGIASGSIVSVQWTPTDGDVLYAKLYDREGNVMAWDTVRASECDCNLTSGDWVDLGLPSGLLWATRNVGASSPTGYGNYYAWGEISPKSVYDWSTNRYIVYNEDSSFLLYNSLTKYCNDEAFGYNGFTDGLTTLQPGDDAATANYGGRTPTNVEWHELFNNTSSRWVTINGVDGRCFTGPNGNSLFLPAAGFRAGPLPPDSTHGSYWSASLTDDPRSAWIFFFDSVGVYVNGSQDGRSDGRTVRAVCQN